MLTCLKGCVKVCLGVREQKQNNKVNFSCEHGQPARSPLLNTNFSTTAAFKKWEKEINLQDQRDHHDEANICTESFQGAL